MIKYEDPGAAVGGAKFTTFKVYGVIAMPDLDPNWSNFHYVYRLFRYQGFNGGFPNDAGTGPSPSAFGYNLTGGGGRNSFRNSIVGTLNSLTGTIGNFTVTTNVTLGYGNLDPLNPGIRYFTFLIAGSCNRTIPNCFLTWEQIEDPATNPSYLLSLNNNNWSLIYL